MKKWRIVLSAILISIAAVACGAAVGCNKSKGSSDTREWTTNSIAHWHVSANGEKESYGEHTFNGEYHCTTCNYDLELAGISVTKTRNEYKLEDELTRPVPVNDITVKAVAADNLFEITLSEDQYELEFYKGDQKLDNLRSADGGAYNIWAKANLCGETHEAFAVVYVVDQVKSFDRTGEFVRRQELGLDEISKTWNFTVTYTSGKTKTINMYDDNTDVVNFSTYIPAADKTAKITYSEADCKGEVKSITREINYTIDKGENSNVTYGAYSWTALKDTLKAEQGKEPVDKTVLKGEHFTGDNSFLTLLSGADAQFRNSGSNTTIEIKYDALQVTFEGAGILVIGCRSTSDSDYSAIALKDAEGNFVAGTFSTNAAKPTILADEDGEGYAVTGGYGANQITFTVTKPGTYTICSMEDIQFDGDLIETNRYTRIESIELTDIRIDTKTEVK